MKALKLSCGYKIEEKKKKISLFEAYKLLTTKCQHHYTKVERCGNQAILYWHTLRCPYCNKEIPAYPHYLYENCNAKPRKSFRLLYEWAQMQMPLFEDGDTIIYFQQPEYYTGKYICPKCSKVSSDSNKIIEIEVNSDDTFVYITRKIENIKDILEIKWLSQINLIHLLPVYERLVFDFETGDTFVQLISDKCVLNSVNIKKLKDKTDIGIWETQILENNTVKRNLKKLFQHFLCEEIPFTVSEISLEKLIFMTRFMDFPKDFYEAIPIAENSYKLYENFECIANDLRNPIKAMKRLNESTLPYVKSVKKVFVQKTGLFFYIKECEELFSILEDLNLFCKLLSSNKAYIILSMMHNYPGIKELYRDYCEIKNAHSLCKNLILYTQNINNQAIRYCALSPYARKEEKIKWKENKRVFKESNPYFISHEILFATPMYPAPTNIKNCNVNRYRFKWLITKNDYTIAGKCLNNCLRFWRNFDNPVVAIYKGKKIIAAIEVKDDVVMQFYKTNNAQIEKDSPLYSAIEKWCDIYLLNMSFAE